MLCFLTKSCFFELLKSCLQRKFACASLCAGAPQALKPSFLWASGPPFPEPLNIEVFTNSLDGIVDHTLPNTPGSALTTPLRRSNYLYYMQKIHEDMS